MKHYQEILAIVSWQVGEQHRALWEKRTCSSMEKIKIVGFTLPHYGGVMYGVIVSSNVEML